MVPRKPQPKSASKKKSPTCALGSLKMGLPVKADQLAVSVTITHQTNLLRGIFPATLRIVKEQIPDA